MLIKTAKPILVASKLQKPTHTTERRVLKVHKKAPAVKSHFLLYVSANYPAKIPHIALVKVKAVPVKTEN